MGDLVGQHPVLAEVEDRVGERAAEVAHRGEHVDGKALERPVHAGEAQDRVLVARRFEQQRLLGELAELGAHVIGELHRDLDVASLVPALPGHVELELERDLALAAAGLEVPTRAPGALERLDLADEDAVHQAASAVGSLGDPGIEAVLTPTGRHECVAGIEDHVFHGDAHEPIVSGELSRRHQLPHRTPTSVSLASAGT